MDGITVELEDYKNKWSGICQEWKRNSELYKAEVEVLEQKNVDSTNKILKDNLTIQNLEEQLARCHEGCPKCEECHCPGCIIP